MTNNTMKCKVKICGIKTIEAALTACNAGADFLGFNFVPTSKRLISIEAAKKIISELPKKILKVGVFMDADISVINKLVHYLKFDYVQLHGDESPKYVSLIQSAGIMKTFSLSTDFDVNEIRQEMEKYNADYFLLDRKKQGTGELLNSAKVKDLTSIFPVILAGGLMVENVVDIVHFTKPQVVDVAGGVETDGIVNTNKIMKFIQAVKQVT